MTTRMYRAAPTALILLASVALMAGCGSSTDATTTTDTTAAAASAVGGNDSFATCLKEHGVELPQGGFGAPGSQPSGGQGTPGQLPEGVDASKFQEAMQACGGRAPRGGFPGGGAGSAAFTKCMKDRGIEVGQGQSPGALPEGVSQDELQAAQQACRDKAGVGATGANGAIGQPASGFARFATCMKKNGITLPGAAGSSSATTVDASSAAYKKAEKACSNLLQAGGSAGGTP